MERVVLQYPDANSVAGRQAAVLAVAAVVDRGGRAGEARPVEVAVDDRRDPPAGDGVLAQLEQACGHPSGRHSHGPGGLPGEIRSQLPGEHRGLQAVGSDTIVALLTATRTAFVEARRAAQTDHLQLVQNWGAQAGARTNHLCLDLYDLPQIPHRVAEELGGAARFVIREGECPWCRLVRTEAGRPDRLVWQDADTVAFSPFASRSPFEVWIVPRRHDADFGRATDADVGATAEALRQVLGALATTLDGPPYNLVLHTAPLREQVDATYHWHWEVHPRLREIAGLELGTGLPVNPVSPEDAVEELLARVRRSEARVAEATG